MCSGNMSGHGMNGSSEGLMAWVMVSFTAGGPLASGEGIALRAVVIHLLAVADRLDHRREIALILLPPRRVGVAGNLAAVS